MSNNTIDEEFLALIGEDAEETTEPVVERKADPNVNRLFEELTEDEDRANVNFDALMEVDGMDTAELAAHSISKTASKINRPPVTEQELTQQGIAGLQTQINNLSASLSRGIASSGGGGSTRLMDNDDVVFKSGMANNDIVVYNADTGKFQAGTPDENISEVTGTRAGFTFTGGFARRGDQINSTVVDKWIPLDFDIDVQRTVDAPWWPGAEPANDIDLFGGTALPYGVTRLVDFNQTWDSSGYTDVDDSQLGTSGTRTGTIRLDELSTGQVVLVRLDVNVTTQVTNSLIEFGIWFQPKTALDTTVGGNVGLNDGGAFSLPSSILSFGSGVPGSTNLIRNLNTFYIASSSDQFAFGIPVFKCNNPVIIDPQSFLLQTIQ
jgi:hypothetical protein